MLGFLEFVTLNYASIFGLLQDAVCAHLIYWLVTYRIQHLNSGEFAWLGSIYYFGRLHRRCSCHHCANTSTGYLAFQPFAAILLQRFTPAQCLSFSMYVYDSVMARALLTTTQHVLGNHHIPQCALRQLRKVHGRQILAWSG